MVSAQVAGNRRAEWYSGCRVVNLTDSLPQIFEKTPVLIVN
jgi:hypothetical protein